MLEITKAPITLDQFVEKMQSCCPKKFSEPGLKIIFQYLEVKALFHEAEVYLPDICESDFQESTFSQCSSAVRNLLKSNFTADRAEILACLQKDLGKQLIGITEKSVIWWNG
jgi:hypothetical protein